LCRETSFIRGSPRSLGGRGVAWIFVLCDLSTSDHQHAIHHGQPAVEYKLRETNLHSVALLVGDNVVAATSSIASTAAVLVVLPDKVLFCGSSSLVEYHTFALVDYE